MFGDIKVFRKQLFGGFDRRDVMEYIGKLAHERNKSITAASDAEAEAKKLRDELTSMQAEYSELEHKSQLQNAALFNDALKSFSELEAAYANVRAEIEASGDHMRSELLKVDDAVALMSSAIKRAGIQLDELRHDSGDIS